MRLTVARRSSRFVKGMRRCKGGDVVNLGIKNLRVLVTAGAGGIGLEIARAFVAEGAKVHVCDVDKKALRALAKSDPKITRSVCDVSDRKQVAKLFKEALAALGGLDVLVNNAGIAGPTGKVDEIAPEDWDRTPRDRHHRPVQLRAACGAAPAQEPERLDREPVVGRGPARLSAAHALFGGEMGGGRLHQVARGRAWAGRHPRQRDPARHRGGRAHRPRDGEQGEGARHQRRRRCWRRRCRSSRCAPR